MSNKSDRKATRKAMINQIDFCDPFYIQKERACQAVAWQTAIEITELQKLSDVEIDRKVESRAVARGLAERAKRER